VERGLEAGQGIHGSRSSRLFRPAPRRRSSGRSEGLEKIEKAGTIVSRLGEEDVDAFTKLAIPRWYAWANKDKNAARVFKIQLDYMMSGSLGYVTPDMIKGQTLKL
jgi:hypothetical protein